MDKKNTFASTDLFFRYLDDQIQLNVVPIIVGYERCSSKKEKVGPISKPISTLHLVTKGCGYFQIGQQSYKVTENQLFIVPPSEKISYYPDKDDPWEYIWIEFTGLGVKSLCDRANITTKHPVYVLKEPDAYIEAFSEMLNQAKEAKAHSTLMVLSCLLRVFSLLIDEHDTKQSENNTGIESRMRSIVDYIDYHIGDPSLSLEKISKAFFLNGSYLSRKFKEVMGMNISKYIISLRMRKAFIMLKTKQFSIAKVAEAVGYSSPFYFSKAFKKYTKISPKQYVEEHISHEQSNTR